MWDNEATLLRKVSPQKCMDQTLPHCYVLPYARQKWLRTVEAEQTRLRNLFDAKTAIY